MNSPLVKSLKTVKSMAGSASTLAEIKRHRKQADLASRLATPKGNVDRRGFRVGKIRCEEFKPNRSYDPDSVGLVVFTMQDPDTGNWITVGGVPD